MSLTIEGTAHARAGLLGNPGDGYGGRVLAFTVANFTARVTMKPANHLILGPVTTDDFEFPDLQAAYSTFVTRGCEDGVRLLKAALTQFVRRQPAILALPSDDPRLRFEMRYRTDIPRQVGLAGSSAIVTATIRALLAWFETDLAPAELAELALQSETVELGIAAGAMDRVVQAYGGLVRMDFGVPRAPSSYQPLDPRLLPHLLIAWDPSGGEPSGRAHGDLRARWNQGDPSLREAMRELSQLTDEGVRCLETQDDDRLRTLMNRNFDLRASFFPIREADRRIVALARTLGAGAKLCGSGGAVLILPLSGTSERLSKLVNDAGYDIVEPRR